MKTGLDHLPEDKCRELAHVVAALREGFAEAKSRAPSRAFATAGCSRSSCLAAKRAATT